MQDIFRSQFRLPADLADKLRNAAEANNRSMNAEIVARLEHSFSTDRQMEELAFQNGFETAMLHGEVARLKGLLLKEEARHRVRTEQIGIIPTSALGKFAGQLHDLQGQRNTLALVAHALRQSNSDPEQLLEVQRELALLDEQIAQVVISIQKHKKTDSP